MAFRPSIHLSISFVVGVVGIVLLVYGSCTLPDKSTTVTTGAGVDIVKAQAAADAERQAVIFASGSFKVLLAGISMITVGILYGMIYIWCLDRKDATAIVAPSVPEITILGGTKGYPASIV